MCILQTLTMDERSDLRNNVCENSALRRRVRKDRPQLLAAAAAACLGTVVLLCGPVWTSAAQPAAFWALFIGAMIALAKAQKMDLHLRNSEDWLSVRLDT